MAETQDFSPEVFSDLRNRFQVSTGALSEKELKNKLREVDVFWFRLGYRLDATVLDTSVRCKYLVTPVTGIDHIDEKLCQALGIEIICLRGEYEFLREVRATAEHTVLLAMVLMRRALPALNDVQKGNWRRDLYRGYELLNKKVGIIGYGRLGVIVADYFKSFGCEVGFYDIIDKPHPDDIRKYSSISKCISESDIISLHVPYNKQTHHLINRELFNLFDCNKWLINTSRGGVVEEAALLNALERNHIAGAAIDVLYGEPDVKNHPLVLFAQRSERLIITPHIGGCTYESFEKTEKFIAQKLYKSLNYQPSA